MAHDVVGNGEDAWFLASILNIVITKLLFVTWKNIHFETCTITAQTHIQCYNILHRVVVRMSAGHMLKKVSEKQKILIVFLLFLLLYTPFFVYLIPPMDYIIIFKLTILCVTEYIWDSVNLLCRLRVEKNSYGRKNK